MLQCKRVLTTIDENVTDWCPDTPATFPFTGFPQCTVPQQYFMYQLAHSSLNHAQSLHLYAFTVLVGFTFARKVTVTSTEVVFGIGCTVLVLLKLKDTNCAHTNETHTHVYTK